MFFDPLYLILTLPPLFLGIGATLLVKFFYSKYSKVENEAGLSGIDLAKQIAQKYDLGFRLNVAMQDLADHYDPSKGELTLSSNVAHNKSIASVGIAAHELGHIMQHKSESLLMKIRNLLVPAVNIGTMLGYFLFILGLSLQIFGAVILGIALFSLATIFTIITLPIEIDASIRAMNMLRGLGTFSSNDLSGAKKVLTAASLTYVAALLQSVSTLLYYIIRAFGGRRR